MGATYTLAWGPVDVASGEENTQCVVLELDNDAEIFVTRFHAATAEFTSVPSSKIEHEADFVFVGDIDINVPPTSMATVGRTFVAMPPGMNGANYFAITGHTHKYGTDLNVATVQVEGGAETPVYDLPEFDWDEPATVAHAPAFTIANGGGFNFTCEYNNTSNQTLNLRRECRRRNVFFLGVLLPQYWRTSVCTN